jgi:hypothetical protein
MEFGSGNAECGMKKNRRWEAMEFGLRPIGAGPTPRREVGMRKIKAKLATDPHRNTRTKRARL